MAKKRKSRFDIIFWRLGLELDDFIWWRELLKANVTEVTQAPFRFIKLSLEVILYFMNYFKNLFSWPRFQFKLLTSIIHFVHFHLRELKLMPFVQSIWYTVYDILYINDLMMRVPIKLLDWDYPIFVKVQMLNNRFFNLDSWLFFMPWKSEISEYKQCYYQNANFPSNNDDISRQTHYTVDWQCEIQVWSLVQYLYVVELKILYFTWLTVLFWNERWFKDDLKCWLWVGPGPWKCYLECKSLKFEKFS